MNEVELNAEIKRIIEEQGGGFTQFRYILKEILREYGNLGALKGKRVIEMGPGGNFTLIDFLSRYAEVEAVGLSKHIIDKPDYLTEQYLLEYLVEQNDGSADLIYSRRVMEQHSFEASLLLGSEAYKRLIREGPKPSVWLRYPGARLNIIQCYLEAKRILKPRSIIISHVGNRLMARFHDRYREQLGFEEAASYPIGLLAQMWVYRKPSPG